MRYPFKAWDDIYLIGNAEISHPYDCCIYLVNAGDLILIDSGAGLSFDAIVKNIKKLGFDPGNIRAVIATHAHIDHIGSLHLFQEIYGAQIIAHELDADAIESGVGIAAEAYGVDYVPCAVDIRLSGDMEPLRYGNTQINLVHIPGHTPGSIAVYVDMNNKRVLFGQDIHGPYITEWGADRKLAAASLQKLKELKADILCEGHFGVYQPAEEVSRYIEYYMDTL